MLSPLVNVEKLRSAFSNLLNNVGHDAMSVELPVISVLVWQHLSKETYTALGSLISKKSTLWGWILTKLPRGSPALLTVTRSPSESVNVFIIYLRYNKKECQMHSRRSGVMKEVASSTKKSSVNNHSLRRSKLYRRDAYPVRQVDTSFLCDKLEHTGVCWLRSLGELKQHRVLDMEWGYSTAIITLAL